MKKASAPHRGGVWKVAYADFITAMMALFLVLWISAYNPEIAKATSQYFQDPYKAFNEKASGVMDQHIAGSETQTVKDPPARETENFLKAVARDFNKLLNVKSKEETPIDVQLTSDGLRFVLYNRSDKPLFNDQTAELTPWGKFVIQNLAWLVERYQFNVFIEGHTNKAETKSVADAADGYGPWELSSDRANSARRMLEFYAVDPSKIQRVSGYGYSSPLPNHTVEAAENQRISVSLSVQQRPTKKGGNASPAPSPSPA